MAEEQAAESSSKTLGSFFPRPDAPESSGSDDSPSPTETATTQETKAADAPAPVQDKKEPAQAKTEGEQPIKEVKAEAEAEGVEPPEKVEAVGDAKPTVDWDNEENPYKQKFTTAEKQYNDTRAWARGIDSQRKQLEDQLNIINKKLDGTYDPAVDDPKPDPQAVVLQAQAEGKMLGSLDAAYMHYGKGNKKAGQEFVDKEIARYNELFSENPQVQSQIWNSPAPVFTALRMVRDFDISQKYGTNDAAELIDKIKAETRSELEKELTEKVTKQVLDGIAMKNKAPAGINGARGAPKVEGEAAPTHKPLGAYFAN